MTQANFFKQAYLADRRLCTQPKQLLYNAVRLWAEHRGRLYDNWSAFLMDWLGQDYLVDQAEHVYDLTCNTPLQNFGPPWQEADDDQATAWAVAYTLATLWWLARERHFPAYPTLNDTTRWIEKNVERQLSLFA